MQFKNPLKKEKQPNLFKTVNTMLKEEIAVIEKVTDPSERLARYAALEEKLPNLYGNGKVKDAARGLDLDEAGANALVTGGIATMFSAFFAAALLSVPVKVNKVTIYCL